jgi:hypothetical protein
MAQHDPQLSSESKQGSDSTESSHEDILKKIAQEELDLFNEGRGWRESARQEGQLEHLGNKMKENSQRSGRDVMKDVLTSVAMEQTAMSYLIQAEANKVKAFTGAAGNFPTMPTNQNIKDFQNSIARVVEAMVEKQKLLTRMVELSKHILDEEGENEGL